MSRLALKPVLLSLIVLLLFISSASAMTLGQIGTTCLPPSGGNGTCTCTLGINWTFTGAPGTSALVTDIGSHQFDFTIPAGSAGALGPAGADGIMNQTSNMTAGPQGTQGTQGIPGINGTNGTNGITPEFGVDYFNGTDGAPGAPGSNGTNGTNGSSATITINNTQTVSSGTPASVTNIGTALDAIFDFIIPAGPQGEPGDPGTPGTNGTTPVFGVDYFNGTDGTPGTPGTPGINGTNGTNGLDGTNGTAATIGINYTFTGQPGTDAQVSNIGTLGAALLDFIIPSGSPGQQGTPGTNGTNGINGTNGTTPVFGIDYFNGSQGIQGIQGLTGPMNQTANLTPGAKGDKGDKGDTGDIPDSTQFPFLNGTRTLTGIWNVGGYNLSNLLDPVSAQDAATRGYVLGLGYITSTYNATYDAKPSSTYNATYDAKNNYNASYITSTFNATYDSKPSSTYNATYDAKSNYNASYITSTYNVTYDAKTNYNASYLTSTYNVTYDNKANITQYSHITLMAGSALIPTTNPPANFDQLETSTNKNNFIYSNITNAANQNIQWIVDMPADWNGGNIITNFLWSVQSGTGDLNWTLSGLRFDNDAALDTALPLITYKVDTVLSAGDLHVSDATTAAAITGTGNFVILKVGRSTTDDTLAATPGQLIGVRIKYIKTIGAA